MRGLYRGYLLANIIALLHLNIYASVKDLWERARTEKTEWEEILGSKEVVGSVAAILLLHPLDTVK